MLVKMYMRISTLNVCAWVFLSEFLKMDFGALHREHKSEFANEPDEDLVKLKDGVIRNCEDAEIKIERKREKNKGSEKQIILFELYWAILYLIELDCFLYRTKKNWLLKDLLLYRKAH